jgi:2-polyprenyl-3-methyl-5-hydroxy-6-metoxy-1,4-benzoquinol methylase
MSSDLADLIDGTPGRFLPDEMRGELVEAEHLCRYWWAAGLARDRRVLDAGCGIGYGAAIMSAAGAAQVDGVDIADEVVEAATAAAPEGVRFRTGDVRDLPFPDDSFDLVVCFEVIEHVEDQDRSLDELRRVLAPGGVLAISSPNPAVYVPGNPHHKRELGPDELRDMLASRFGAVRLLRQNNFVAAAVRSSASDTDQAPHAEHVQQISADPLEGPTYSLALAGDEPLPESGNLTTLAAPLDVRAWVERFAAQQEHIDRQSDALEKLRRRLEDKEELGRRLAEAETALAELPELRAVREQYTEMAEELEQTSGELERCRAALLNLETSASWRLTAPLRSAKQNIGRRRNG